MEGKLIPARGKSMCDGQCEERPASVLATANVRGQNSRAAGGVVRAGACPRASGADAEKLGLHRG